MYLLNKKLDIHLVCADSVKERFPLFICLVVRLILVNHTLNNTSLHAICLHVFPNFRSTNFNSFQRFLFLFLLFILHVNQTRFR
jgi:hypothetical protein